VRVISMPALLGVTGLILATLVFIFPRDVLIAELKEPRPHSEDELAATYGAAVLKSVPPPKDDALRIVVAERQYSLSELPEARATLAPLKESPDAATRREAGLLDHKILRLMIDNAEPGSAEQRAAIEELKRLLAWLSYEELDPPALLAFARESVGLGLIGPASRFYRNLVRTGAARDEILREAVRHELGHGHYRAAAELYLIARTHATTLAERRQRFRLAIDTLLEGALTQEALLAAEQRLGDLSSDEPTLRYLARVAVAADERGRPHAKRYYRMLVDLLPGRADVIEEAARHALSLRDYDGAAELYFIARNRAAGAAARRAWFQRGVAALQSGGLAARAFDAAEQHLGELADDEETLRFLVRLALKANDQERAQAFSRRLLRLAPAAARTPLVVALLEMLVRDAHAQSDATTRPYNEESYRLAFDVFVANSNFADARRVAQAAVAQRPDDLEWRARLAQVAEWSREHREALQQWIFIAARRPSREAFEAMLRLAPGLGDDEAHLAAWRYMASVRALTGEELWLVMELFENTGRVDEGLQWFAAMETRAGQREFLAIAATMAERAGRIEEAIAMLDRLDARHGLTVAQAVQLATLHFTRSDFARALGALERVAARVTPMEHDYWRLFGAIAWQLGDDAKAMRAYRILAGENRLERFEYVRLLRLLREAQPLEAARLAEAGWRETRDPELFILAADIYTSRRDRRALERLFATVTGADEARFADNPFFFTLRARLLLERGLARESIADARRALALRPDDLELRTGFLWTLIEARGLDELRQQLRAWRAESLRERAYWPAFAAGYQTIGEPRSALPYYRLGLADRTDDYLWLLGFADALEDAAEGGMAWRVRRHAWHAIRAKRAEDPSLFERPAELLGYARLVTRFAPGDPDLAVMRQVLSQGLIGSPNPAIDAVARELILAWALTTDQPLNAKAWLWQRFARQLARPAWGEIAVALAENDLDRMEALLARNPDALPRYDRVDATRAVRMTRLGQSLGWASQAAYGADDDVHWRLEQDLRADSPSVIAGGALARFGVLRYREESLALDYWLTPNVRLTPSLKLVHPRSTNDTELVGVPSVDRTWGVSAEWRSRHYDLTGALARRDALASFTSASLAHVRRYNSRVRSTLDLGRNLYAPESAALRVGGMKDEARARLTYDYSKREYVTLGYAAQRFLTQARSLAGTGRRVEIETGYRIRTDYPNLTARLYAGNQSFNTTERTDELAARINPAGTVPPGSFFLPRSFSYYSAAIGFGEFLRRDYSRAVRPFADAGVSHNTATGAGYNFVLGVGGSVFGADHLSIGWTRARGGTAANVTFQEIALRYQMFF
jgi:hypothetical protein